MTALAFWLYFPPQRRVKHCAKGRGLSLSGRMLEAVTFAAEGAFGTVSDFPRTPTAQAASARFKTIGRIAEVNERKNASSGVIERIAHGFKVNHLTLPLIAQTSKLPLHEKWAQMLCVGYPCNNCDTFLSSRTLRKN